MSVGKRIQNARNELHLSRQYVSDYLGIQEREYILIEIGVKNASDDTLKKLSKLFCLNSSYFTRKRSNYSREYENMLHFKQQMKSIGGK